MKITKIKRNNSIAIAGSITSLEIEESCVFNYNTTPIENIRPTACRIGKKLNRIYKVSKSGKDIIVSRLK